MDEEKYEITALIGKSRTGGVYKAHDLHLNREVALRRFFSNSGDTDSSTWSKEFKEIALALSNIEHPNLLTVLDAGVDEDGAYLATKLTNGSRLQLVIPEAPFDEALARSMALQLLDALTLAHAAGFIHGALTPGSILMNPRPSGGYHFTIMDLGLSRLAPLIQDQFAGLAMMADPIFIAPELFSGQQITEQSDCYMLGHLIYCSLVGGHPFAGSSFEELEKSHTSGAMPPLTAFRNDISPGFVKWLSSLTEKNPKKRCQSVEAAMRALAELPLPSTSTKAAITRVMATETVPHSPPKKRSKLTLFAITATITVISLSVFYILNKQPNETVENSNDMKPLQAEIAKKTPPSTTQTVAVTELRHHCTDDSTKHPLTAANVTNSNNLDWTVYSGDHPCTGNHVRPDSDIIGNLVALGNLNLKEHPVGTLTFFNDNGEQFRPSLFAQSESIGDGWSLPLHQLSTLENDLKVTVHYSSWDCNASIQFLRDDETPLSKKFIFDSEPLFTSFAATYTIPKAALAELDSIQLKLVTTKRKSDKPFALSLNAIIIE